MFDPTAYENMKVVVEGAAYDMDLDGLIKVIDRKDIVDLATLSRWYEITYCLNHSSEICAKLRLEAKLNQLATELLQVGIQKQVGSFVYLSFSWNQEETNYFEIIKHHWGPNYIYDERRIHSSLQGIQEEIMINFSRFIVEEMIDDLVEMFYYSVETLKELNKG
ncbi:hypothetical protein [Heyndrickxia vini]|uniref:Uncharacterized protein n=1 Tax=Heyndrickxia vini TaxID=1476025 RepID=A0ABX7E024_9BACI|nr:hypothetical protein [Heyndrickxia vini]QQZ07702.1 hypothetical protein I5776_11400 [Heyndrickxia vini]